MTRAMAILSLIATVMAELVVIVFCAMFLAGSIKYFKERAESFHDWMDRRTSSKHVAA